MDHAARFTLAATARLLTIASCPQVKAPGHYCSHRVGGRCCVAGAYHRAGFILNGVTANTVLSESERQHGPALVEVLASILQVWQFHARIAFSTCRETDTVRSHADCKAALISKE